MSNIKIDFINNENSVPVTMRFPSWIIAELDKLPKGTKSTFIRIAIIEKLNRIKIDSQDDTKCEHGFTSSCPENCN